MEIVGTWGSYKDHGVTRVITGLNHCRVAVTLLCLFKQIVWSFCRGRIFYITKAYSKYRRERNEFLPLTNVCKRPLFHLNANLTFKSFSLVFFVTLLFLYITKPCFLFYLLLSIYFEANLLFPRLLLFAKFTHSSTCAINVLLS